jgi:hypothetical protein
MLTSIPKPLVARHSFFWGFSSAMVASLLLATSYAYATVEPLFDDLGCRSHSAILGEIMGER